MATKKNLGKNKRMGDLHRITGWMKPADKTRFVAALRHHKQFQGQSEFLKCVAECLIDNGDKPLAQPLRLLTEEDRDKLAAFEVLHDDRKKKR